MIKIHFCGSCIVMVVGDAPLLLKTEQLFHTVYVLHTRTLLTSIQLISDRSGAVSHVIKCHPTRSLFACSLQRIDKLSRYRHISVPVGPPIPQTCLKACKIGNLSLILRKPRHENRDFRKPRARVNTSSGSFCGIWDHEYAAKMPTNACLGFHKMHTNQSVGCKFENLSFHLLLN